MYRYLLPAILLLPAIAAAQDDETTRGKKIKCTVVDATTKKTVKNVTALLQGNEEKIIAPNGMFTVMAAPGMQVEITADGYEPRQVMITPDNKCYAELAAEEGDDDDKEENDKEE